MNKYQYYVNNNPVSRKEMMVELQKILTRQMKLQRSMIAGFSRGVGWNITLNKLTKQTTLMS